MSAINMVTVSGNLGRDPELRQTVTGTNILTFSLAVNERVKRGEEWEDYTNWFDIVTFGRRAEGLSKVLAKGMKLAVSGKLRYASWEKDGQKRSKVEIIADNVDIMQRKEATQGQQQPAQAPQYQQQGGYTQPQQYAPQNGPYDYQPSDYDGYWD